MKTISQKNENRGNMNFRRTRSEKANTSALNYGVLQAYVEYTRIKKVYLCLILR